MLSWEGEALRLAGLTYLRAPTVWGGSWTSSLSTSCWGVERPRASSSTPQWQYQGKLEGKGLWRGPIHLEEFTLANYPHRMENSLGQGAWEGWEAFGYCSCRWPLLSRRLPGGNQTGSARLPFWALPIKVIILVCMLKSQKKQTKAFSSTLLAEESSHSWKKGTKLAEVAPLHCRISSLQKQTLIF